MKRIVLMMLLLGVTAMLGACAEAEPMLRVEFFDVGKADAMLITTPDNKHILIDAATNDEGKKLARRLEERGVHQIDLMIITHFDKDHVGGADQMLKRLNVRQVLIPVYEKESKQHTQFMEALEESKDTDCVQMEHGKTLSFDVGGAAFTVTSSRQSYYGKDEENDFSLVVRMRYGQTRFLFAGDAEEARQKEILLEGDVACDVLKTPYHGRLTDMSPAFIEAASPKIAFVTDSDEEPASEVVLSLLSEAGAQVYSARNGGLTVVSDGKSVAAEAD